MKPLWVFTLLWRKVPGGKRFMGDLSFEKSLMNCTKGFLTTAGTDDTDQAGRIRGLSDIRGESRFGFCFLTGASGSWRSVPLTR